MDAAIVLPTKSPIPFHPVCIGADQVKPKVELVQHLLVELQDVFAQDGELRNLVGSDEPSPAALGPSETDESIVREASSALLSMGFTSQEIERALEGRTRADAGTLEKTLSMHSGA